MSKKNTIRFSVSAKLKIDLVLPKPRDCSNIFILYYFSFEVYIIFKAYPSRLKESRLYYYSKTLLKSIFFEKIPFD